MGKQKLPYRCLGAIAYPLSTNLYIQHKVLYILGRGENSALLLYNGLDAWWLTAGAISTTGYSVGTTNSAVALDIPVYIPRYIRQNMHIQRNKSFSIMMHKKCQTVISYNHPHYSFF